MKTKFVKISVSERLPEKAKNVTVIFCNGKSGTCYYLSELWHGQKHGEPKFWLEEVPDREDEMREAIEEFIIHARKTSFINHLFYADKFEKLLNELKQTT